jgi:hypothetical protein
LIVCWFVWSAVEITFAKDTVELLFDDYHSLWFRVGAFIIAIGVAIEIREIRENVGNVQIIVEVGLVKKR